MSTVKVNKSYLKHCSKPGHKALKGKCKICQLEGGDPADYKYRCDHLIDRHRCKICVFSICAHGVMRRDCGFPECYLGDHFCDHGRAAAHCTLCGNGKGLCMVEEHYGYLRPKQACKTCSSERVCEHDKFRTACWECNPNVFCKEHNQEKPKYKSQCEGCHPEKFCPTHHILLSNIKKVFGDSFCKTCIKKAAVSLPVSA